MRVLLATVATIIGWVVAWTSIDRIPPELVDNLHGGALGIAFFAMIMFLGLCSFGFGYLVYVLFDFDNE